jgi:hypothetical protein
MGRTQGTDHKRFDWPRFWTEQGGTVDLSDGGYLSDPKWSLGKSELRTLQDLTGMRALALLGEPGMGKSVALAMEADRQRAQGGRDPIIFHADLRAYSSDVLLNAKVFESPELTRWKAGTENLVLYLDSLDEALLRIETVAAFIADELPRLPTERLSVRIACRTLDWHAVAPTLNPVFRSLWGEDVVGAFEIAPLRRQDVVVAATAWPVDVDRFMEQVWAANVVPFAIKPLTLNLLLRLFKADGRLPASIAELYRRGCLSLCEEQSASRRAPRREGRLAPPERAQLAGRIAAVSMLANRYAVWTGLESAAVPEEDVAASVLAVGAETTPARTFAVKKDELREVLDTGLFSSRGDDRMGWAHQSYAEFLTAEYLIARRVPAHNVLDILRHPSGGLVPQLNMVAAWAASLDKDIRRELIEHEPVVLMHGDLTGWDDADRGALATALLQALNEDRAHDFEFGMDARYRKMAHPGLSAIVRPYLVDGGCKLPARRAAIRIAEASRLTDLRDELLAVAFDQSAEDHIRGYAVSALETCGDDSVWPALKPLALGGAGSDRDHEIKGHALALLWPKHLDAETLFQNISLPRESYFGAYANFLTRTLPESLQRGDLPAALRWATAFASASNIADGYNLKRLADAILRRAWTHIQDPEITPLVLDYVRAAIGKHYQPTLGTAYDDNREFSEEVARDTAGRRAFLRAAIAARVSDHFAYWLYKPGLLTRDDLPWLLDLGPGSPNAANDLDEAALIEFIEMCLNLGDDAHFAMLYEAAERWPLLRSKYAMWFDGVPLDSSQAEQMRRYHEETNQFARQVRPKLDPPPEVRIADRLDRFEAGDLNGWWLLFRELTLDEDSTHYGGELNYEITAQPGWAKAGETVRRRILDAARVFLDRAEPTIDQWMGRNKVNFSDLAAYRALVLLREEAPEVYRSLGASVRAKWAPLVVTVPKESGTEQAKIHDAITAEAVAAAPAAIAETVSALIRMERERSPAPDQQQNNTLPPFFFLNQLQPSPGNGPLNALLLGELDDARNTPAQYGALLSFLVRAGSRDAIDDGLAKLQPWPCPSDQRELALTVAATLLEDGGLVGWPVIWPVVQADQDFGRELFLRVAQHHRFGAGRFAALPEAEHGDLYVWFEETFPHHRDVDREGVHWVSPTESVGQLRDGVLGVLVQRGTPEAVAALRSVMARLPALPWLAYRLLEADQLMRQRTWQPLTPGEVLRLMDNADGRLVQSPEQLADVLVEMLRVYEAELHGEQSPVNALWNRELHGPEMWPKEEDALSDHVKLFLQRALVDRGVVLNREVEIGRVPGAAVGSRTDIRVDAVRRAANGDRFDTITAIIETKGCWNPGLKTAIETQLRDNYLIRTGAPVGIYLAGWFDKAKWRADDGRRNKTPDWDVAEAQQFFDAEAARLSTGFIVRAVVLDCHAA